MDATIHHNILDDAQVPRRSVSAARIGRIGEDLAAHHLVVDDALRVVARNWRLVLDDLRGELDLVATDDAAGVLVICEVKTRRDAERFGGAAAAISPRKQARLRRLTAAFLRESALHYPRVRIDLVAIDLGARPTLTHLQGAL